MRAAKFSRRNFSEGAGVRDSRRACPSMFQIFVGAAQAANRSWHGRTKSAIISVESSLQPVKSAGVEVVEQHGIETAGSVRMAATGALQPPACGEDDALLFASGDAFCCRTEARIAAQANFDKDNGPGWIHTDQINFATTAAHIACQQMQALRLQMAGGEFFGEGADGLRR